MIISRTPFRISFFGGGSDFASHFCRHGGKVISVAINKYCYLNVRQLPPFFSHRHRVVYSKTENVSSFAEIEHPAVRAILEYLDPDCGVSILHDGDIPARSGIGSSSAFTVGLLNSLCHLLKRPLNARELAETAIYIEQELIGETVGCQDQICCAYGGFNVIDFPQEGGFKLKPVTMHQARLQDFKAHMLLIFTGISRISSLVAQEQKKRLPENSSRLIQLADFASKAEKILCSGTDLKEFGELLHQSWLIKRSLSDLVSNPKLDEIYNLGMQAGAYGGKLLGAGAGGFMLFFARPDKHPAILQALQEYLHVPFDFDCEGSKIIFSGQEGVC